MPHGYCPVAAQPDAKREKREPSSEAEADGKSATRLLCVVLLPPRSASTKQANHHATGGNLEAVVL